MKCDASIADSRLLRGGTRTGKGAAAREPTVVIKVKEMMGDLTLSSSEVAVSEVLIRFVSIQTGFPLLSEGGTCEQKNLSV